MPEFTINTKRNILGRGKIIPKERFEMLESGEQRDEYNEKGKSEQCLIK